LITNGHNYIAKAIELGATTIVHDEPINAYEPNVNYVKVRDSRKAASMIAADFYDHPSRQMKVIGITGTNGKTSWFQCSMLFVSNWA
jgi:UDP-N-acetylmuramyl tripeptide synthase